MGLWFLVGSLWLAQGINWQSAVFLGAGWGILWHRLLCHSLRQLELEGSSITSLGLHKGRFHNAIYLQLLYLFSIRIRYGFGLHLYSIAKHVQLPVH